MATMNRVYSLYNDSYESSLEKFYERGLIFMPSCRRKATRNIVRVTEIHQDNTYFTVADVRLDLRINVTADDYEDAYEEAEALADDVFNRLPSGVAWVESQSYDFEQGAPAVDWDWAVGE